MTLSEGVRLANEVGITPVALARKPNLPIYADVERFSVMHYRCAIKEKVGRSVM